MKRAVFLGFVISFCWSMQARAALIWHQDGEAVEEMTVAIGEIVEILNDLPRGECHVAGILAIHRAYESCAIQF